MDNGVLGGHVLVRHEHITAGTYQFTADSGLVLHDYTMEFPFSVSSHPSDAVASDAVSFAQSPFKELSVVCHWASRP